MLLSSKFFFFFFLQYSIFRQGARAMKGARGNLDVDNVDEVMVS